jgi:hypothetical protein
MKIPFLTLPVYMSYFPKWEPRQPRVADFDEHVAKLKANLSEPSRRGVIRAYTFQQSHRETELRLDRVRGAIAGDHGNRRCRLARSGRLGELDHRQARLRAPDARPRRPPRHVEYPGEVAEAVLAFERRLPQGRRIQAGAEPA